MGGETEEGVACKVRVSRCGRVGGVDEERLEARDGSRVGQVEVGGPAEGTREESVGGESGSEGPEVERE